MQQHYGASGYVPRDEKPLADRVAWFITAMRNRAKDTGDADVVQEAEFLLSRMRDMG
jgi:hypothetical protein